MSINPDKEMRVKVLFVCTGNTCRSPMAEVYFKYILGNSNRTKFIVKSGGIYAEEGSTASEFAKRVILSEGLSLENFKSKSLEKISPETATLIVGMTAGHVAHVNRLYPKLEERTHSLMTFLGRKEDISDPYGGSVGDFFDCFLLMKPALEALLDYLKRNFNIK